MNEDELSASLASWVPPWQRPTPAGDRPGDTDASEPGASVSAVDGAGPDVPGSDSHTGGPDGSGWATVEAEGDDDAEDDGGAEGGEQPDGDAPEREWQQPETDRLGGGIEAAPETGAPADDRTPEESGRAPDNLAAALEAILLVVDEPVSDDVLAEVVAAPVAEVSGALAELAAGYTAAGRGFDLRRAAGGWRLYTRVEYAPYVERFVLGGQSVRLTQAALETLAVVAYQQPVTRARMSAIRGVNCDGVVRTLTTRGLIEECGTQPETGAFLYRTTPLFLEKLGLDSLDELPPLAPFLPDDVNGLADA